MPANLLIVKAKRFIQSANVLEKDGDYDSAASRLYYAMFFIAQVLLDTKSIAYSSHKAVISGFGQHFVKTGEFDPRFHRALISGFGRRQLGDYAVESGLQRSDIEAMRKDVEAFLASAQEWVKQAS
ncbi:MAG: HEPN domain-containing protein [Anaerolineaceae bacterium]|nr:MAG: HEPN domain-containing protein [Anaerolineaceae bacterium]